MKIKTGDKVRIQAGKDKGKEGKVTQTFPKLERVVVEGVNTTVKFLRANGKQKGQRVEFNAPIHVSNVQVIAADGKVGRIGAKFLEKDGTKVKSRIVRHAKKTEDIS